MANNVQITPGTGDTVLADPVVETTLGAGKAQIVKLMDATIGSQNKLIVTSAGAAKVDGSGATQPISAVSLPLPTGAAQDSSVTASQPRKLQDGSGNGITSQVNGSQRAVDVGIDVAGVQVDPRAIRALTSTDVVSVQGIANATPVPVVQGPATLAQSATAATGVAVTVTLPAVASQFHYITLIEITKYFTVANAASATPLVVTTTNLPGSLAFTFGQPLGTIGTTDERVYVPNCALKSLVVNTATTIVCPATTGIIWRVNVWYYAAT